jgi:hypothetical protein
MQVSVRILHPDKVDRARAWFAELTRRSDEVLETFRNEGNHGETVVLVQLGGKPALIYVVDVDDPVASHAAYEASTLPIDVQHREVMHEIVAERLEGEVLFELRAPS